MYSLSILTHHSTLSPFSLLWSYGILFVMFTSLLDLPQPTAGQFAYDNQIEGRPEISCGHGNINFRVKTTKGKPSSIYVKGNSENKECIVRDAENASIPLNTCNMRRKREVNPAGIGYTMTIIVQMHPLFVTKVDRAYNVHCFYMEAHKNIDTELFVSDITTQTIQSTPPLPTCTYTIHKDSPNGPKIKYARVGDQLYHVWDCPSDVYGMLLHTCEAVDGTGNKYMIVDGNGCSIDEFLLPQIAYNNELTRSMVGTYAFNFPDRTSMIFSCQIQLCYKKEDCDHITPPKCGARATESTDRNDLETSLAEELDTDQVFTSLPVTIPSILSSTTTKNETNHPLSSAIRSSTSSSSTSSSTTSTSITRTSKISEITTARLLHASENMIKSTNSTKMPEDFPLPGTILPEKEAPIEGSGEEVEEEKVLEEVATSEMPEKAGTSTLKLLKKMNRAQRDTPIKARQINFDISSPELTIMDDYLGRLDPAEQVASKPLFEEPSLPAMKDKICISSLGFFTFAGLIILFSITVFCILLKSRKTVHKFY